jgi:hypothetical protein
MSELTTTASPTTAEVTSTVCTAPASVVTVVVEMVGSTEIPAATSVDASAAATTASDTAASTAIAAAVVGGAATTVGVETVAVVAVVVEALDDVVKLAPAVLESFAAVDVVAVVLPAKTSKLVLEKASVPNIKREKFFRDFLSGLVIFFEEIVF